jgi:hypothetical protein
MISLFFLQMRQEKICTKIDLVTGTRSCLFICLLKNRIVKAFKKNLFCILPKIYLSRRISGRISGIRPYPDIRYPALGLAGYPAKTVSGASLFTVPLPIQYVNLLPQSNLLSFGVPQIILVYRYLWH